MRAYKWLVIALSCLIPACARAQTPPLQDTVVYNMVYFDYPLVQLLLDVGSQFKQETAICLLGHIEGTTIFVDGMRPAYVEAHDSVSVRFSRCGTEDVVGWFHNHPGLSDSCYPSFVDQETTDSNELFKIMLISCAYDGEPGFVYKLRGDPHYYPIFKSELVLPAPK